MLNRPKTVLELLPIAAMTVIGMTAVVMAIHAMTPVFFPDEFEFFQAARAQAAACGRFFCPPDNYEGYGSLWWGIFQLAVKLTAPQAPAALRWTFSSLDDPALPAIYTMRLLSVAVLLAASLTAVYNVRRNPARLIATLTFFALPIFWWNGRWAGPDFFGTAAAIFGVIALLRHRPRTALLFFGIAAALRISNAIGLAGFGLLAFLDIYRIERNRRARIFAFGAGLLSLAAGYLIGDPSFPLDPINHIIHAKGLKFSTDNVPWKTYLYLARELLIEKYFEWDMQTVGSLAYFWGGSLLMIATLVTGWLSYRRRFVIAALAGAILLMAAMLIRGTGYGWYFMPLVAASYIAIAGTVDWRHITGTRRKLLVAMQMLGLLIAVKDSAGDAALYYARFATVKASVEDVTCTLKTIENRPAAAQLWLNLDPVYTMMPVAQGTTENDHILPMHETVESITKQTVFPTASTDYYVTSDPMLRHSLFVQGIWRRLAPESEVRNCGPFIIMRSRTKSLSDD